MDVKLITQPEKIDRAALEEAVIWGYRMLLGREPEDAAVVRAHALNNNSVDAIRRMFVETAEFKAKESSERVAARWSECAQAPIVSQFPPWSGRGELGFWRDFMGVRTRCAYLPPIYKALSGTVEGPPGTERVGLHEVAEWTGTLRSVLEARTRGRLVVIELGAGWGPWLVSATKAAERVGIENVSLAGVEGAESHYQFMRQHFIDNGLDPDAHRLIHGVVGTRDGEARFPKLNNPSFEWGTPADFDENATSGAFEAVACIALTTLIHEFPYVDLIHCDIQGHEVDVLVAAKDALQFNVRRVVIGTHGRHIEADLIDFFLACGWRLEDEGACTLVQPADKGPFELVRDGYQVWANPRFEPQAP